MGEDGKVTDIYFLTQLTPDEKLTKVNSTASPPLSVKHCLAHLISTSCMLAAAAAAAGAAASHSS